MASNSNTDTSFRNAARTLGFKVIEVIMNSITLFEDKYLRPAQNASQIDEYTHATGDNTMLHEQLNNYGQQSTNGARSQTQRRVSENNFSSTLERNPRPMPSTNKTDEGVYQREVEQYRQQHSQLLGRYRSLLEQMGQQEIDSFEALARQDKQMLKLLIELMQLTEPMPMEGQNIGFFGITSTGKSTLLNALLGTQVAETGVGETTTKIKPYPGNGYVLWDVPGRNDEVSYFTMEYISFFKGLSKRLILIQATVKENSSLIRLLDASGLRYAIVVNKFDRINENEREALRDQIRQEINEMQLRGLDNVFFVSAKQPEMFSDWVKMVNYFQNTSR